jgi:hypothetical protein
MPTFRVICLVAAAALLPGCAATARAQEIGPSCTSSTQVLFNRDSSPVCFATKSRPTHQQYKPGATHAGNASSSRGHRKETYLRTPHLLVRRASSASRVALVNG